MVGYQPPAPVYGDGVTDPYREANSRIYRESQQRREADNASQSRQTKPRIEVAATESPAYQAPAMSPAVVALLNESDRNSSAGDLDSAVVVLERALRLDSRNPTLTYRLAELRIKQEKPRLAEDLAKKAALLAAGDLGLKRKSWLLISKARQMQHNYQGAKEAKIKADSFISP